MTAYHASSRNSTPALTRGEAAGLLELIEVLQVTPLSALNAAQFEALIALREAHLTFRRAGVHGLQDEYRRRFWDPDLVGPPRDDSNGGTVDEVDVDGDPIIPY